MYYFIFDQPDNRRLAETAKHIEDAVTSQGIVGEIIHLNPTKSIEHCLSDAHQKGYQTVVAVGDPKLVNKIASRLLRYEMVLGIIPLGNHPTLLEKIGAENWEEAAVALRQRRWQYAPLGHINNSNLFLTKAILQVDGSTSINITNGDYQTTLVPTVVSINTRTTDHGEHQIVVNCESVCRRQSGIRQWWQQLTHPGETKSHSLFSATTIQINSTSPLNLIIDQTVVARTPLEFSVIPKALRLIIKKGASSS